MIRKTINFPVRLHEALAREAARMGRRKLNALVVAKLTEKILPKGGCHPDGDGGSIQPEGTGAAGPLGGGGGPMQRGSAPAGASGPDVAAARLGPAGAEAGNDGAASPAPSAGERERIKS